MSVIMNVGRRFYFHSKWRSKWTVSMLNSTFQIPGNFLHNGPVLTALQIKNRTLTPRAECTMCTQTKLDTFTQLPLVDSQKGHLIYSGPLSKTIRALKIFSLTTSGLSLCIQPLIIMNSAEASLFLKIAFGSFFSFFVFGTPLLIHIIAKKYVTGVYFEPHSKTFTALKYSFFCRSLNIQFTAEDVKVPDVAGPFTSLIIKGKALFMDPKFFLDKNAYIHLMGYDKPLDWELPKPEDKE